jgi:hypothetical protein
MFGVVVNYRLLATIATTSLSLLPVLTFMSRLGQEVPVEEKLLSELLDTHQQLDEVIEQQQEQHAQQELLLLLLLLVGQANSTQSQSQG